ncbi:hypothetical protein [Methylobacter marinus]|uniref:hypothetical protein n=1 Tax=Methylobacter marinus TaxID=34058 RepID=UPI00037EBF70|nr:hypothetical protein [Methylobacter marinus]
MKHTIISPKEPAGTGWVKMPPIPQWITMGFDGVAFQHIESGLCAISAVEVAQAEPGAEHIGPEYHISISKRGQRCTMQEAKWVLKQFNLEDAEEDNHVPDGKVRNFWRPVADRLSGYQCPCKDSEPAIREDGGDYVWRGIPK